MNINKTTNRLEWIDTAKGTGILLVVLGHSILGNNLLKATQPNLYYFSYNFIWLFHMPLFFFLSGLFMKSFSEKPLSKALISKVQTVLYPYIIWSVIFGGIYLLISYFPNVQNASNNQITLKQLLLFPFYPILHLWFLYILFGIQILYLILNKLFKINYLFIFLISLIMCFYNPFKFIWFFNDTFTGSFFFLSSGAYLSTDSFNNFEFKKYKIFIISFILAFLIINTTIALSNNTYEVFKDTFLNIYPALLGIFSVILFSIYIQTVNFFKIFGYLGKMSLYIYLIHPIISPAARIVMEKFLHIDNLFLIILTSTISGIVFSILFYKLSTKLKLNKLLFGK
ncbi:MAG: acyltransferase [bacterium]